MYQNDLKSRLRLRDYGAMNGSRLLLYTLLAAALLVSGCAGQPESSTQGLPESSTQGLPETPIQGHSESTGVCGKYRDKQFSIGPYIFFDFDSATLRPDAIDQIDKWVDWLKCVPDIKFMIEGHTDARGPRDYNLDLGCRRAGAAREALIERGIPAKRMQIISYGEDRPRALGDNEAAWSQNRLAVIVEVMELRESSQGQACVNALLTT